jgi:hypothetical protein
MAEIRHSFERCIVCDRPKRVYRSRLLRPGGYFCTRACFQNAWRAFRRALRSGQLKEILLEKQNRSVEPWLYYDAR